MEESTGDTSSTLNANNTNDTSAGTGVTVVTLNTPSRTKDTKGKSKTKPLYFWTSADVNKWLRKHGEHCYDMYGDLLLENDVTGRTFILLNEMKLERIGIKVAQHRKELMQHVAMLRLKHELVAMKSLDQQGAGFELRLPEPKKITEVSAGQHDVLPPHSYFPQYVFMISMEPFFIESFISEKIINWLVN